MMTQPMPVEVFCAYAHEDEAWLHKLEAHLGHLKRQGLISLWHDRSIFPGTNWAQEIDAHLETASVILLLVSADFIASDYCYGREMKRGLKRQEAGEACVIPIYVRPVEWTNAPFAHLQALPTNARPLAVWKNRDAALADVAAGLRRVIAEDVPMLSARAPRTSLPSIWNIPYPLNPFFLGRDDELARLRSHLQVDQIAAFSQPQAISGLGGIGKTQLALEYAYRYHQDYQMVLWARAESTEALISSYVALATLLHLPERESGEQDVAIQAVKIWLQTHRDWLLILDNADELALLPNFLPPSLGGHLILTTRATATGRLAQRLEIETLLPEHGALFLLRRANFLAPNATLEQASPQERKLALQISRELGGLPLALDQAGAYLEETGMNLADYWQIYQQYRANLLTQRRGLVADHPASVATTWSLSFQQIEEKHPAAAGLLRVCAFLSPDAIPEEILTEGSLLFGPILAPMAVDAFLLNQAIEALRTYSLVRRDSREKRLSIHRLVQAVLQDTMEEEKLHIWAERAVLAVNAAFPHVERRMWPQCERLLSQALTSAQLIERYDIASKASGRLLHETASYLKHWARYSEAEPLYQRTLEIYERVLGPDHLDTATTLDKLASLYSKQGKYDLAEPLYQRTLEIYERILGPDHLDIATTLDNLASLYNKQGKYDLVEPFYQRTLAIRECILGPEHPSVALSLIKLAFISERLGKHDIIEPLCQRTLAICQRTMDSEEPDMDTTLNDIAYFYNQLGKYDLAESLYQRALEIRERTLGPDHSSTALSLNNLAHAYDQLGKYDLAESLYQRALGIRERTLGPDHSSTALSLNSLATFYAQVGVGKYELAVSLYQRALEIRERVLGPDNSSTALSLENLAYLYSQMGKYDLAEPLHLRALSIRERTSGTQHPKTATCLSKLAYLYSQIGKYDQAELLYQRALAICEHAYGPKHPKTATSFDALAGLYSQRSKYDQAKSLYQRALATREQALGVHHPSTMETRTRFIALLQTMGHNEEAAQLEAGQTKQRTNEESRKIHSEE